MKRLNKYQGNGTVNKIRHLKINYNLFVKPIFSPSVRIKQPRWRVYPPEWFHALYGADLGLYENF